MILKMLWIEISKSLERELISSSIKLFLYSLFYLIFLGFDYYNQYSGYSPDYSYSYGYPSYGAGAGAG